MNQMLSEEQILRNVSLRIPAAEKTQQRERPPRATAKWTIMGFGAKSKVLTIFGHLPIEALRRNDPLKTECGKFSKVMWVDAIKLDPGFLSANPQAQPILIPAGAIGHSKPAADMLVSPAQMVQSSGLNGRKSFVSAASLAGPGGISKKPHSCFTYYLFGCGEECSVFVDGLWCRIFPKMGALSASGGS